MIHLDLQPEVEAQLAAEAHARGIALERLIEEMSRAQFASVPSERLRVADAVDRILRLRKDTSLDGLTIKGLINEGRKY